MTGWEALAEKAVESAVMETGRAMETKAVSEGAIPRADEWKAAQPEVRDNIAQKLVDTGVEHIDTINQRLEGLPHPVTGVVYEADTVKLPDGRMIKGVFPKLDSVYETKLSDSNLQGTDYSQFKECNNNLRDAMANDPEVRSKFTAEQQKQIENGDKPEGYTWHHNQQVGRMHLVETEIHAQTDHTGGRNIWGGGTEARAG